MSFFCASTITSKLVLFLSGLGHRQLQAHPLSFYLLLSLSLLYWILYCIVYFCQWKLQQYDYVGFWYEMICVATVGFIFKYDYISDNYKIVHVSTQHGCCVMYARNACIIITFLELGWELIKIVHQTWIRCTMQAVKFITISSMNFNKNKKFSSK